MNLTSANAYGTWIMVTVLTFALPMFAFTQIGNYWLLALMVVTALPAYMAHLAGKRYDEVYNRYWSRARTLKCICGDGGCWHGGSMIAPAGCVVTCEYCYHFGVGPHPMENRA